MSHEEKATKGPGTFAGKAIGLAAAGCAGMMFVRALRRKGGSKEPLCPCAALFAGKERPPEGGPA